MGSDGPVLKAPCPWVPDQPFLTQQWGAPQTRLYALLTKSLPCPHLPLGPSLFLPVQGGALRGTSQSPLMYSGTQKPGLFSSCLEDPEDKNQ